VRRIKRKTYDRLNSTKNWAIDEVEEREIWEME
jgi:hypothetical protein